MGPGSQISLWIIGQNSYFVLYRLPPLNDKLTAIPSPPVAEEKGEYAGGGKGAPEDYFWLFVYLALFFVALSRLINFSVCKALVLAPILKKMARACLSSSRASRIFPW